MSRRLPGNTGHPGMTAFVLLLVVPLFFHVSCRKEPKEIVEVRFNPDSTYTMKTLNMTTFISDSGITKYKMVTPECLMFEEAREPYWFFPKGVYAEQFDTLLQVEASVKADTAFYYVKKDMITGKDSVSKPRCFISTGNRTGSIPINSFVSNRPTGLLRE